MSTSRVKIFFNNIFEIPASIRLRSLNCSDPIHESFFGRPLKSTMLNYFCTKIVSSILLRSFGSDFIALRTTIVGRGRMNGERRSQVEHFFFRMEHDIPSATISFFFVYNLRSNARHFLRQKIQTHPEHSTYGLK